MGSQSSEKIRGESGAASAPSLSSPSDRPRAWLRFGLGNAQMFTALVALILMFRDGLTSVTLVAVAAACAVTAASRILFARDRHAAAPSAPAAPAAPPRSHNP
jgi:hypothetical protein